ncbi:hypothetical protein LOTGIDRAFT_212579 [Lottia gigantea]|uniref:MOSC domain-containing protein n=1 Tax=Lottia gigantea TaxID=225164 RepID=V4CLB4_LOTGI|nr:hypothetical protein LOTGIDRAFT_212579 [Lottia gigantea]ESP03080.1 hypothetical protein LOTGIDRAFT_212579 [Lottia gigantea]
MLQLLDKLSTPAVVFATLSTLAVTKYVFAGYLRWKRSKDFVKVGTIECVYCFPIKSCSGMKVQQAECSKLGIRVHGVTDRHYLVIQPNGDFITQRQEPKMALIKVTAIHGEIQLTADGMSSLNIPKDLSKNNQIIDCRVWNDRVKGMDCGQEASDWLHKFLGIPGLRLVHSSSDLQKRDCSKPSKPWGNPAKPGDEVAYGDFCAYLIANTASLEDLNKRLSYPVTFSNFRPNIVVKTDVPYDEDNWSELRIGETIDMRMLDGCTRCQLTTVNPDLGAKSLSGEPLKTLKAFRCFKQYGSSPIFCVNGTVDTPGPIAAGDPVYAIRKY